MANPREELEKIQQAGHVLCAFCGNTECEKCQVTLLLNDAYLEYGGNFEDEEDEDEG